MADALGPLPALDSQAASAGLVAVDPTGCHRSVHSAREGCRQGEVTREQGRMSGTEVRKGESPGEEVRWEEWMRKPGATGRWGVALRERDRVRQGNRCKQKHGGKRKSLWGLEGASTCHADT